MALAPPILNRAGQVRQELIVSRLAHRLGLRQETVWARLGELRNERRRRATPKPGPSTDTPPAGGGPPPAIERQLLEILLAEPELVPDAVRDVPPDRVTHTGLRRVLGELYALFAGGERPDLDALRVRLIDRPDLAAVALRLQDVGRHIPDRAEWFAKIVRRFTEQRAEADTKELRNQLATGSMNDDAAVDVLRKIQARTA